MSHIDANLLRDRIREVALRENKLSTTVANDVAFHMTDWLNDLEAYHRFCSHPAALSDAEVSCLLIQFLAHVPNHVAAAGKLYTSVPVTDVFGVGATTEHPDDN